MSSYDAVLLEMKIIHEFTSATEQTFLRTSRVTRRLQAAPLCSRVKGLSLEAHVDS